MFKKCCPLSAWSAPLGTATQSIGLALMSGGILALGAFTAPAVFGGLPRSQAALVMLTIFRRFDLLLLGTLVLSQVGEYLRWISHAFQSKSRINKVRLVLVAGLTVCVIYSAQVLNPQLEQMNLSGVHRNLASSQGRQFDQLHKRSEGFAKAELLMALLLLLLTPFVRSSSPVSKSGTEEIQTASCCPS